MLYLASSAFEFTAQHTLHIGLNSTFKSGESDAIIKTIHTKQFQFYKVGLTSIASPRLNYFDTIVLHPCSYKLLPEYLAKLKRDPVINFIRQYLLSGEKNILAIGSAISILPDKVLWLPKEKSFFLNPFGSIFRPNVNTPGLGLIKSRLDYNFQPEFLNKNYGSVLKTLSDQMDIFLLDNKAVYSSDQKVRFGEMYILKKRILTKIYELPELHTDEAKERMCSRTIKPCSVIYSKEEQLKEKAIESKPPSENK